MKTLIAILALSLLVLPMLAGIGRIRRLPRHSKGAPEPSDKEGGEA